MFTITNRFWNVGGQFKLGFHGNNQKCIQQYARSASVKLTPYDVSALVFNTIVFLIFELSIRFFLLKYYKRMKIGISNISHSF